MLKNSTNILSNNVIEAKNIKCILLDTVFGLALQMYSLNF